MNTTEVKKSLLRKASMNKTLAARVAVALNGAPNPTLLTASQRQDLTDAIRLVQGKKEDALPTVNIKTLPRLAPAQVKAEVAKLASLHQEIETVRAQFAEVLKKLDKMEKEEEKGLDKLKDAAKLLQKNARFVLDAETALLQFTGYSKEQLPGVVQMITTTPGPKGEKAGDLLGRIATELGEEIATQVGVIYAAVQQDLTHTTQAIRGLTIVAKTASLSPAITKRAGILDAIGAMKDWVRGTKANMLVQKILGFAGDIGQWLKEFTNRSTQIDKASSSLQDALNKAEKDIDGLVADLG